MFYACSISAFYRLFAWVKLYFGAPESLVQNRLALIGVSFFISVILAIFGLYALSGAGRIQRLPWLKPVLISISAVFILRGLMGIPELLVVMNMIESPIPIAPRFVFFSMGALLVGGVFLIGIVNSRHQFEKKEPGHVS